MTQNRKRKEVLILHHFSYVAFTKSMYILICIIIIITTTFRAFCIEIFFYIYFYITSSFTENGTQSTKNMLKTQSRLNAKDIKMTFQIGFETNESGLGVGVFPNVNGQAVSKFRGS